MTADELKVRRRALGLTQAQLAGALGINLWTLRQWEQGRYKISLSQMVDAALERLEQAHSHRVAGAVAGKTAASPEIAVTVPSRSRL